MNVDPGREAEHMALVQKLERLGRHSRPRWLQAMDAPSSPARSTIADCAVRPSSVSLLAPSKRHDRVGLNRDQQVLARAPHVLSAPTGYGSGPAFRKGPCAREYVHGGVRAKFKRHASIEHLRVKRIEDRKGDVAAGRGD